MNFKQTVFLILVCVGIFGGYLFLNPFVAYDDSYAFMSMVCGIGGVGSNLGSDLFSNLILPLIPCNFFIVKIVLLGLFITSVLSISVFGENTIGSEGWRAGLFAATLSPLLFMEATKFENDIFGWTLSFAALAVFSYSFNESKRLKQAIIAIFGLVIAFFACFLYSGSVLMVISIGLMCLFSLIISLPLIFYYFSQGFNYLTGQTNGIAEELPGVGLVPVALLFVALFDMPKKVRWAGFFTFAIGLVKAKLMIFCLPFLAVGMVELDKKMRGWKHWANLSIICLIFVPVYFFIGIHTNPDAQDFALIQNGINLSKEKELPLYNDWSIGWWVNYSGFDTNYKASFPDPDYNNLEKPFVALTLKDTNLSCELVGFTSKLNEYYCD